jgi:hypothetical protein
MAALVASPSPASEPLRFGMLGSSLVWTWMSPQMFEAQRALGVQDARIEIVWSDLQRSPGEIDFRIADNRFNFVRGNSEQRPMRALPTLFVGRGWMTCDRPCERLFADGLCDRQSVRCQPGCECCQRCRNDPALSRPPRDLLAEPDPEFGYSRTYYDFVRAFVARYREQLSHLVVENEIDHPQYWDTQSDPDGSSYLRLLATAYKAVKDVEPRIRVTDSGLSSTLLGLCIARRYLEVEQRSAIDVFEFLHEYLQPLRRSVTPPEDLPRLSAVEDLGPFLSAAPSCAPLDNLLAQGTVDVWNFHYYEGHRSLPAVAEHFLRADALHGRPPRPLLANEISCRQQAGETARDQARCLFQNLVTAQALGLETAAWYGVAGQAGLSVWDSAGNTLPASASYRLLATRLGDKVKATSPPERGPELFRANASGIRAVALWSWDGAVHSLDLPAPGNASARVFDYLGGTRLVSEPGQSLQIDVGTDPLLIVWEGVVEEPTCSDDCSCSGDCPSCPGDCNGDGEVTINELITGVNLALSSGSLNSCPAFDLDSSNDITIDELVRGVGAALEGCGP